MSQSSDGITPVGVKACKEAFFVVAEVLSARVSVAAPPHRNAAARRSAIVDFVDFNKCFMGKSPFFH